jgi:hypothetical protein
MRGRLMSVFCIIGVLGGVIGLVACGDLGVFWGYDGLDLEDGLVAIQQ